MNTLYQHQSYPPPLVSVVMPVYNGGRYLPEAIESILNQTFSHFELIIIDDGSIDNSWDILTTYAAQDSRIVLSRNPENIKLIKTLNRGLSLARGQYIARMDADDISLPERLERQVAYLQRHPEVGLLGTGYYRLNDEGKRSLRQPPLTDTEIRWKLLFGNIWCHPSIMFRSQLFETGELVYRLFTHAEDYELWTRLLQHTCGATLRVPLVIYRVHDSSVCTMYCEEQTEMVATISARQIRALLPQRTFTLSEIKMLRRCYSPDKLTQAEMDFCPVMFELFKVFERQPNVDHVIVRRLRRQWIKRLLALNAGQLGRVWTSGLLWSILRHDPMALFMAGFVHLPQKFIRQLSQIPSEGAAYSNVSK
jgi:glycosyltransferase involved in cell wall biosynthesis